MGWGDGGMGEGGNWWGGVRVAMGGGVHACTHVCVHACKYICHEFQM